MQSKKMSLIEAGVGILSGLVISIFFIQPIVFAYYGIVLSVGSNTTIAIIFTVASFIRSYFMRRFFNWVHIKQHKKYNKQKEL